MNKMDELLRNIAIDCLRKANLIPQLALKEFIEEVRDAGGLMCELHSATDSERGREQIHPACDKQERVDVTGESIVGGPGGGF